MTTKPAKLKEECAKLKNLKEQVKSLKLLLKEKMNDCVDKTNESL